MGGLNLNAAAAAAISNSNFNFGNMINNLVSTPASPSRLLSGAGQSNSPFPMMPMPTAPPNPMSNLDDWMLEQIDWKVKI
jgi:CCR4-NOT transcription complex subunit 1